MNPYGLLASNLSTNMHLPTLKTLLVTALAATAFIAQPVTAEAKSKRYKHGYKQGYKHGYSKHYKKHHRHYSRYNSRSRYRNWDRDAYYYGPRRHSYYGPRYYTPYRRSGFSLYLNL